MRVTPANQRVAASLAAVTGTKESSQQARARRKENARRWNAYLATKGAA